MFPCPSCGKPNEAGHTYCLECGELYHDHSPWWDEPENKKMQKRNRKLLKKNLANLDGMRSSGKLSEHDYHVQLDEMLERLGIHSKLLAEIRKSL